MARRGVGHYDGANALAEQALAWWPEYTDLIYEQAATYAATAQWQLAADHAAAAIAQGDGLAVILDDGTALAPTVWQEDIRLEGAAVVATHTDGPGAGEPAVTRNAFGEGQGWYVGTVLSVADLKPVLSRVYADAGVTASGLPEGVEVITRHGETEDFVIAINHRDDAVALGVTGQDLLSGNPVAGEWELGAGEVAVIRSEPASEGGGR